MTQHRNVIATFPLGYSAVSLYALASMMGNGLVVAVCPGMRQIRRNLEHFKQAELRFPEVAFLDGTQMPHEERAVHSEINRNRVKLLYITPERFVSLTFLEVLVHATVNFMVVEEADRLLPHTAGHATYRRFYEGGLQQLAQLPPLALVVPPLPQTRMRELADRLGWVDYERIQGLPALESATVQVAPLFTEHQKFTHLVNQLSGSPGKGKLGRLHEPGVSWIQTAYPAQAEKLGASLLDYGFESVGITHYKKTPREQSRILTMANTQANAVVVSAGSDLRYWVPDLALKPRLVLWTPPVSVDELLMQVFRYPTRGRTDSSLEGQPLMQCLVYHTKEDYLAGLKRLQSSHSLSAEEVYTKTQSLKQYRRWVLSRGCRWLSLIAYFQGTTQIKVGPCGRCDQCLASARGRKGDWSCLPRLLKHWIF
jgi:ATP-dependent DNA helicase RecQ